MANKYHDDQSLSEVHGSVDVEKHGSKFKKILSFFGPAYLISVGYMDPGNWATDLAGGSQFGYSLLWVLLMSNIMALLLQSLSARLGIVRGRDLAQANREAYPKGVNFILYILAEIAIAATDMAEVLGMAIGIYLLTDLPLVWGVAITVFDTFLLLFLQRLGMRKMEVFIIGLVAVVGLSFLVEILLAKPDLGEVVTGFIPTVPNEQALYIAIGIIGATVMPHNLYLHSALVQTRKINKTSQGIKQALKWNFIDLTVALNLAFLVNAAILVLAATTFFKNGETNVAEIKEAHRLLAGFLGSDLAPKLFAIALIAAGQSSTVTGTLAGQIVMEGYLRLRINPWLRRLLTRLVAIVPALIVIYIFGEDEVDNLLILSQVLLSMQLGFAIIPLIHFVSDKKTMGEFTIKPIVQFAAWLIASILIYLNVWMVGNEAFDFFRTSDSLLWKIVIVTGSLLFLLLLLYTIIYPLVRKRNVSSIPMHAEITSLRDLDIPVYSKIAVALDFSVNDTAILSAAIGQNNKDVELLLIHVVESASSKMLGSQADDFESRQDSENMRLYVEELRARGFRVYSKLGYRHRTREIVRIVREEKADMLVIGAHGHSGIKDFIYGETINSVRHALNIPVLVVRV
ncbi:MAG: iron/manganese transporter [Chitinophagaceae bacterium]|nr:MAG: iron/manganese transporter [Chitinophagaceae bacterium]